MCPQSSNRQISSLSTHSPCDNSGVNHAGGPTAPQRRAAALRRCRRRAYHAERPNPLPKPSCLAELRALTAAWEAGIEAGAPDQTRRLAEAFERHLSVAERATNEEILVEAQAKATEVPRLILAATAS
jgi:hypothetical protein